MTRRDTLLDALTAAADLASGTDLEPVVESALQAALDAIRDSVKDQVDYDPIPNTAGRIWATCEGSR